MADTDLETHETLQSPGGSLADELYGHRDQETQPEPEEKPQIDAEDDPSAAGDEIEEKPTDEAPEDEKSQETPPEEVEEVEEVEITSLAQLAEHLETDQDWLKGLKVTEKVNGQEVEVALSDALATHRKVTAGDAYLADAKEKALATMEVANQEKQTVASTAVALNALLEEAEKQINGDMTQEQWARLRREDPAEYSARREEIRERRAKIDDMRRRAGAAYQDTATQLSEQAKMKRAQQLPQEREIFLEMVPEWGDQQVAERESKEITEYLQSKGHSPEEIEVAAYNGKLLAYVRNSMLYERGKGKVETGKKKVVKIPKVMKPGSKSSKKQKPTGGDDDRVSILYGSN